jgi:glycosyltransferase involved in cell wall biosynthesis
MTRSASVSVVVPVHNGDRFLGEALDSAFAQEYRPLEVIVVDDGSTDRSGEIARSRPVRYLRRPHGGVSAARNAGAAAARGQLLAFLDADDLWPPDSLAVQVGQLLARPELGFVLGRMRVRLERGTRAPVWYRSGPETRPTTSCLPVVWRRVFEQVGGFDRSYRAAEDVEWVARARDSGVAHALLPEVVRIYRLHGGSTTQVDEAAAVAQGFDLVRARIARARARRQREGAA